MFTKITYLKGSIAYVEANGKLDIYNAPYYLDEVKEYINQNYVKELILEFSKISFIASIGLRSILELYKTVQPRNIIFKLRNVNNDVLNAFKMTGFDKFLIIEYGSESLSEIDSDDA